MSDTHLTEVQFARFDLPDAIKKGLEKAGFTHCTPIQAKALPLVLDGQDVAGQAQTGTGKTAAFLLALFNRMYSKAPPADRQPNQPRALILAPTRELAVQIHSDAEVLGSETDFKLCVAYGGLNMLEQRRSLGEGVDVLIGTPGRVIDCMQQRWVDFGCIESVVLDEADRMFDLGFIKQLRQILRRLPPPDKRLNLMFSATLSLRVTELAYEHMNSPTLIKIESESITTSRIQETVFYTANSEKIPLLLGLFRELEPVRSIIFVNTKRAADRVAAYLQGNDVHCGVLSGDVPQPRRLKLLKQFQDGDLPVLVATDVAARGLHIPAVSHIFNFDLPQDAEEYVHRIGRTARAGAEGAAVSFACEAYAYHLPEIEQYIGHSIPSEQVSEHLLVKPQAPAAIPQWKKTTGSRGPGRGGKKGDSQGPRKPGPNRRRRTRRAPGSSG